MAAGAPEGIVGWIDVPSLELTGLLMRGGGPDPGHRRTRHGEGGLFFRQARRGRGRWQRPRHHRQLLRCGQLAVSSVIHSKTFDNGMVCASEQSVIVLDRHLRPGEGGVCRPGLLLPERRGDGQGPKDHPHRRLPEQSDRGPERPPHRRTGRHSDA